MFAAFLTTIMYSLSAITGRRLANHLPGTLANLSRLLVAALLVGLWSHLFGFGIGGPALGIFFLSGCVGFGVGDLALFQAYPRLGTRRTMVMVQCLAAPLAALTEWVWLGHAPTLTQAAFGAVILVGVGVALSPGRGEAQPTHGLLAGSLFGLVAALCQALGAVLSRKAYAVSKAEQFVIAGAGGGLNAAYQRLLGGLLVSGAFYLCLKLFHRPEAEDGRRADWSRAWPLVVANGILGPTLGVACQQWALSETPTSVVLPIVATTPLMVLPLTRILEGEPLTWRAISGGLIAVAGVIGLTRASW